MQSYPAWVRTPLAAPSADGGPAASEMEVLRVTRPGFASVNSWVMVGDDSVVVIDVQRVLSAGAEVVEAIRATGKPLAAIIITHPHPDHYGGLAAVLDAFRGAPVYASAETRDAIVSDANGYQTATRAAAPDDTPAQFPAPTHVFADGETLTFGSISLRVDEAGLGEAETMSMLSVPAANALFVGDVVEHKMTGFVIEGRSAAWIAQIDRVLATYGEAAPIVYPGHGAPGPFAELLASQREWLVDLRRLTRERMADGALSEDAVAAIERDFQTKYPNYLPVAEIPPLMSLNIKAIAAELSREA